ncbi:MAG TPA: response regulator [Limnobacter sp.]|nr:response regulator [Limnobacter sp.]
MTRTILVVEDEITVALALKDLSKSHCALPCEVKIFDSLDALAKHGLRGDLLICDLCLPDSDSAQTREYLLQHQDSIRIICHSADVEQGRLLGAASGGRVKFVEKGGDLDEIELTLSTL